LITASVPSAAELRILFLIVGFYSLFDHTSIALAVTTSVAVSYFVRYAIEALQAIASVLLRVNNDIIIIIIIIIFINCSWVVTRWQ
jgi:hypothetical protein